MHPPAATSPAPPPSPAPRATPATPRRNPGPSWGYRFLRSTETQLRANPYLWFNFTPMNPPAD